MAFYGQSWRIWSCGWLGLSDWMDSLAHPRVYGRFLTSFRPEKRMF